MRVRELQWHIILSQKANLIQRAGRWYFNRAYPKDLWPVLGKSPFRLSLHTDSLEVALRRRPDAERRYFAAVDKARGQREELTPRQLSEIDAVAIAARWFQAEDKERAAELASRRSANLDIDGYLAALDRYEGEARQAIAEDDRHLVLQHALRLLEEEGFVATRLIQKQSFEGTKLGMHSFRHNWQDAAREAGLHGTAIGQELAGRSKGGDSSNNYGSGFSTAALAEASSRIT